MSRPEDFPSQGDNFRTLDWRDETNWQSLGEVVDRLKRDVEAAYYRCDEDAACEAHDDLTAAEWRLRAAERLKERARLRSSAPGHDRQHEKE